MQNTTNYNLKKPELSDIALITDINDNMDIIDGALNDLDASKLDTTGDTANAKIGSSTASTASYPVPAANDTFKVILGKIIKFFTDIKAAFVDASISGKTITLTKANGTTKTLTTQDTWNANTATTAGYVAAPTADRGYYFYSTDANGAPAWRNNITASNATPGLMSSSDFRAFRNRVSATDNSYNTDNANKVWKCDGNGVPSWRADANTWTALKGATEDANGTAGYAPAPTAANYANRNLMYLRSSGGWSYLPLQNNATTTAEHYALDARMGKTLSDKIDDYRIHRKTVASSSVKITTRSGSGAYYSPEISAGLPTGAVCLGIYVTAWAGATASFVPYYENGNNTFRFMSDISQTVTSINVSLVYTMHGVID